MCLKTVTWQAKSMSNTRSKDKWQKGYKLLVVEHDKIYSPFYNLNGEDCRYVNKQELFLHRLYKNKSNQAISTSSMISSDFYKAGYHIFPVAIAARLFGGLYSEYNKNIFEVEYRKVSSIGTHKVHTTYPVDCVIAQEMRIIRCLTVAEIEEILKNEEKISRTD